MSDRWLRGRGSTGEHRVEMRIPAPRTDPEARAPSAAEVWCDAEGRSFPAAGFRVLTDGRLVHDVHDPHTVTGRAIDPAWMDAPTRRVDSPHSAESAQGRLASAI